MSSRPKAKSPVESGIGNGLSAKSVATTSGSTVIASTVETRPLDRSEIKKAAKTAKGARSPKPSKSPRVPSGPLGHRQASRPQRTQQPPKAPRQPRDSMFDYMPASGVSVLVTLNFVLVAAVVYFLVLK